MMIQKRANKSCQCTFKEGQVKIQQILNAFNGRKRQSLVQINLSFIPISCWVRQLFIS